MPPVLGRRMCASSVFDEPFLLSQAEMVFFMKGMGQR